MYEKILSRHQFGFRIQQCLFLMLKKWRQNLDKGGPYGAFLTDLTAYLMIYGQQNYTHMVLIY